MNDTGITPDESVVRWAYHVHTLIRSDQPADASAEFDRFLAKIKSDALREAATSMRAHKDPGHWNLRDESEPCDRSASPDAWLEIRADRIEQEAGQ